MARLTIGDKTVTVDDAFLKMSPQEQQSTVDEIEKGMGAQAPKSYDLADVPAAALKNAPADAAGVVEGVVDAGKEAYKGLTERSIFTKGFQGFDIPLGINPQGVKDKYEQYNSYDKIKTNLAERPVSTALDVASIVPAVPKLGAAAVKAVPKASAALKKMNKSRVEYPEVSGDVARDLKINHDSGEYNLPRFAGDETKTAVNKLHTNYKAEIDTDYATVSHMLDPKKALDEVDRLKRVEAEKAFRSGDHLRMDKSLRSEIQAVDDLVGHTKEGRRIVNNLKKQVEVGRLGSKVKGGLTQFTDELNPLSTGGGRFGVKGLPQVFTAANIGASGLTGGVNLIAQTGAVTTGRLVDLLTKRGNLPRKYMKDNAKAPASPTTDGLVDVAGQSRQAAALAEQEARLVKATRTKEALEKLVKTTKLEKSAQAKKALDAYHKNESLKVDLIAHNQKVKALQDQKGKAPEGKPPKQDFGISPLAIRAVHKAMNKKTVETNELKSTFTKANKAEEKAKTKAVGDDLLDGDGNPIKYKKAYRDKTTKIIAYEQTSRQAISAEKVPHVKKIMEDLMDDLGELHGRKNKKGRRAALEKALAKATTEAERKAIKNVFEDLALVFEK